jgi:hypothetical protein
MTRRQCIEGEPPGIRLRAELRPKFHTGRDHGTGPLKQLFSYPIIKAWHAEIRAELDASKAAERAAGRPVGVATA